ncbi:MAG: NAD(P)-dependent oxidoreductase, partial [Bdellovibrionaceae bacterium]|nr:NAD(P)-dependent oxidoreductase [Bdellovibrio sp.]
KLFLTGGTGFFGRSFLDLFLIFAPSYNINLTVLSRNPDTFLRQFPRYLCPQITFIKGDILNFNYPSETFDYCLHFATPADAELNIEQPNVMRAIIISGMKHMLGFAEKAKIKKFLFTSSGAVYGPQPSNLTHVKETYVGHFAKPDAYGQTKLLAEEMGCDHAKLHDYEFKIARCFAFTGKHLNPNGTFAIANFIRDASNKKNIEIRGDGTPYRSYLYSDDLIVWLLKILSSGNNGEPYNVGSDDDLNIATLAKTVNGVLNPSGQISILQKLDPLHPVARYVPSIDKARFELGLEVWTSLEEAIALSVPM